jgi:riboflavin kinase/FMN adenylyltransferase
MDVLSRLVDLAHSSGLPSVVVSFAPHPLEIVSPGDAPPLLTTAEEKAELLALAGVNYLMVMPFDHALRQLSAEQFVHSVLLARARTRKLLIGYDHGFGRGRAGDAEVLQLLGARIGFTVTVVPPVLGAGDVPISSTVARKAIATGDLTSAAWALGRNYSAAGTVVHGAGRGRQLGYPTINISLPSERKLMPPHGVYAVVVHTPLGSFGGMLHLGPRPTFDEGEISLEANLFDVDGDFYGSHVRVDFVKLLRGIDRYPDAEGLRRQIALDEDAARGALTTWLDPNNIDSYTRNLAQARWRG